MLLHLTRFSRVTPQLFQRGKKFGRYKCLTMVHGFIALLAGGCARHSLPTMVLS